MNNAKIYMPFQALKGYEEEIKKASTKKEERKVLLDDRIDAINYVLKEIKVNDIIKIIYYNKSSYLLKKGLLSKLNYNKQYLFLDNKKIYFKDIYDIEKVEVF